MAGEKVARILKSKSDFTDKEIESISDAEGWKWIYANRPPKNDPDKNKPQICFTGFRPAAKKELVKKAGINDLKIVKSVTKKLDFLCIGDNAGPKKIEKAKKQGVIIITPLELETMFKTGEVPKQ